MPEFRDRLQRSWPIVITPQIRHRVSVATGASLAHEIGIAELAALSCRPDSLREALWQCVWVEAAERRISRDAFLESLDAASLREAYRALAEAYAADCYSDNATKVLATILTFADRMRLVLTKPIEPEGNEDAA